MSSTHIPTTTPCSRCLPSLPGVRAGDGSPVSTVLWSTMTSCRPFRRASFPSLGDTTQALAVSLARGRALPRAGFLELFTRYLRPGFSQWERQDLLRSWGTPTVLLPCSPTPVGPTHQAMQCVGAAPAMSTAKAPATTAFEAPSHGFGTGCLRFAVQVAHTPRKTRFRLLAKLFRTGLVTRRVPSKGFKVYPTSILLSQVQRSARTFWFSER
jgi:hypothetical protein